MGQALNVLCRDCKVDAYLGYGSYRVHIGGWAKTLHEYELEVERFRKLEPSTEGNKRLREFLTAHDDHDIEYHGEYSAVRDGKLVFEDPFSGEDSVIAEDYDSYTKLHRESI